MVSTLLNFKIRRVPAMPPKNGVITNNSRALLPREDSKDGKYVNNYILLQVYFSNDVTSLQKSYMSESDD